MASNWKSASSALPNLPLAKEATSLHSFRYAGGFNLLKKLIRDSSLLAPDFSSFKRQESVFIFLNLFVLSGLVLTHTLFARLFGMPPRALIVVLAVGFLINVVEFIWLQGLRAVSAASMVLLTWFTVGLNMALAFSLASLSYRQDTQYFALLVAPVLQTAFRFSSYAMAGVISACTALNFYWVWNYFRLHPPAQASEYMEAGTISLVYGIAGVLVWILVNHLRAKENRLSASLAELEHAKAQLSVEEKLAAVGRFSSAIAHEIRNPVAMISSALSTAFTEGVSAAERQEMFEIAAKEATRLERLTTDFLAYARPRPAVRQPGDLSEYIAYVADICRPRATEKGVTIQMDASESLPASIDAGQVQQALVNLVMNAVDASKPGGVVHLRGVRNGAGVKIGVENANGPIPPETANYIFEPFFTTKPAGTGLGLAIARNIAHAHGGELTLTENVEESIQFSMTIPTYTDDSETK